MIKRFDKKLFIAAMVRRYNFFNDLFFANELPAIQFGIVKHKQMCFGITHESPLKIELCFSRLHTDSPLFQKTMLHEMVHVDQIVNDMELGHGEFFHACADIYKTQGYNIL